MILFLKWQPILKSFEIPTYLLENIDELYQDGGDHIYHQLCPFWDGEDNIFNIRSTEDCALLPNLKKMTICYDEDDTAINELHSRGIQVEFL